jgi:uncharacterized protein YdeI (YjbR/CyaY-like superfamily)
MSADGLERVSIDNLSDWRAWLAARHDQADSVWVVTWKKASGGPHVPYGDVRDEALCWGWIDSRPAKLDAPRAMLLVSPRRAGSAWSGVNKARVEALIAAGRMAEPGLAAIACAKADGSWTMLDAASALDVPEDLAAALAALGAGATFAACSPSSRRAILEWIVLAKLPETRAKRVAETARLAALGLRANFPEAKGR